MSHGVGSEFRTADGRQSAGGEVQRRYYRTIKIRVFPTRRNCDDSHTCRNECVARAHTHALIGMIIRCLKVCTSQGDG